MTKTFKIAGVSTLNGVVKCRFANDMLRVKTLEKNQHTAIELIDLGSPMTKLEAAQYLLDNAFQYDNPESVAAITAARDQAQAKIDKANRIAAGEEVDTAEVEEEIEA